MARRRNVALRFGEQARSDRETRGGKGAALVELSGMGLPIPPGFTIPTGVARAYAQNAKVPQRLQAHIRREITNLERATGKKFGDVHGKPLLVSVRSGAAVSMPGMMDTVLNLGMNEQVSRGLEVQFGAKFANDCWRRFIAMFADVVLAVPKSKLHQLTAANGADPFARAHAQMAAHWMPEWCRRLGIPEDPWQQLERAVAAVLQSWNNPRAQEYRRLQRIPEHLGTAVNIQAMVFGNLNAQSGTGVVFSCDPSTGEKGLWGEFLPEAQGEDVVAGTHTPLPISALQGWNAAVYEELDRHVQRLRAARGQQVEVEFTVEAGQLYLLQDRRAKLSAQAQIIEAVRAQWQGTISKEEALASVSGREVLAAQTQSLDPDEVANASQTWNGIPAAPGVAIGEVVTSSSEAIARAERGSRVILFRPETSPEDLAGMQAAAAIVTASGGRTSHAAVVARAMGKPAIVGCSDHRLLYAGSIVSLDGSTGQIVRGRIRVIDPPKVKEVNLFLRWRQAKQQALPPCPSPRLDFTRVKQSVSARQLIQDFYAVESMYLAAIGGSLENEAAAVRQRVHVETAEVMATYLTVAVAGELRHAPCPNCTALDDLILDFGAKVGGSRSEAQNHVVQTLQGLEPGSALRFIDLATAAFEDGVWRSAYGGKKWADVANAVRMFLRHELSHSVFADHAFDLQHNTGSVFGKHGMIDVSVYVDIHRILEDKKHASGTGELLTSPQGLSSRVAALFHKGRSLRVW